MDSQEKLKNIRLAVIADGSPRRMQIQFAEPPLGEETASRCACDTCQDRIRYAFGHLRL